MAFVCKWDEGLSGWGKKRNYFRSLGERSWLLVLIGANEQKQLWITQDIFWK